MEKIKKRELSFDIAKAIAILLVVCYHCDNFPKDWHIFGSLFYMQLFMFVSGYFFHYKDEIHSIKDLWRFIWKKIKRVYVFYLKYEIIFLLLRNVFINIGFYNTSIMYSGKYVESITSIKMLMFEILKIIIGFGREIFAGAFWFLISLIIIIIIYSVINYLSKKQQFMNKQLLINILSIGFFIVGCVMHYFYNIQRFSPACTLLLFYNIGNMIALQKYKIKFNNLLIAFFCLIMLLVLNSYGFVSMNTNNFTDPLFLLVVSFAGIYFTMYISKLIELKMKYVSKILCYIGRNTLVIMAMHFISFKIVMFLQFKFGLINYGDLGILNGANNANWWYILYLLTGIGVPLLYNVIITKIKGFSKNGGNEI